MLGAKVRHSRYFQVICNIDLPSSSLAWMELRTILAKMHFKYDIKLLNGDLDWNRDSEMHTLWKKPKLMVHVLPRAEEAA